MDGSTVMNVIFMMFKNLYGVSTIVFYYFTTTLGELIQISPDDPFYSIFQVFLDMSLLELLLGTGLTLFIMYTFFKWIMPLGG